MNIEKVIKFWNQIKDYILLVGLILVVAYSIYVIFTASVDQWRWLYCSANEANAIECTAKGWW